MTVSFIRLLTAAGLLACLYISAFGQDAAAPKMGSGKPDRLVTATTPCTLTLASLPPFFGVKFGASYEDVAAVYPEIEKDKHFQTRFAEAEGIALFMAESVRLANKTALDGAVQIDLSFKDKTLHGIGAIFPADKWASVAEPIAEYSKLIGVPETSWTIHHGYSGVLECRDFRFGASSMALPDGRSNQMAIIPERIGEEAASPKTAAPPPQRKPDNL